MFDPNTRKGRILAAALSCAAKTPWADVTPLDIAESANLAMFELRDEFATKTDLIAGLLRAIDEEVLKRATKRTTGQVATGQDTAGQDTAGQDTTGRDTAGQDTAGQDTAGRDTAGQEK